MTNASRKPCFKIMIPSFVLTSVTLDNILRSITGYDTACSCYSWRKMNLFHAYVLNWGHTHMGTCACTHTCTLTYMHIYLCIYLDRCFCKQNKKITGSVDLTFLPLWMVSSLVHWITICHGLYCTMKLWLILWLVYSGLKDHIHFQSHVALIRIHCRLFK